MTSDADLAKVQSTLLHCLYLLSSMNGYLFSLSPSQAGEAFALRDSLIESAQCVVSMRVALARGEQ